MSKFIQNYSILAFPALIGCTMTGGDLYIAIWAVIGTFIVLVPMLRLSKNKSWYIRLLYGFIGIILFYILIVFLNFIILKLISIIGTHWWERQDDGDRFITTIIAMGYGIFLFLKVFYPANIAVVLCFLLNDIYAKKIDKIICRKKEVENEL
ncbi:MAG: hypothetical protein LBC75_08935 [Fibromonadaceae bacterium]|jgi:hypothetical protein|nr:hypothetical protein [Fibromonadaceae bacterium]